MEKLEPLKLMLLLFAGMGLMIAVGVYVLRQEGEKTREAMREGMQEVAQDAGLGVQQVARESIKDSVESGVQEASNAAKEITGSLFGTLSEAGRDQDSEEAKDQDPENSPTDSADDASSDKEMKNKSSDVRDIKPADVVGGLFKIGNEVLKKADDVGQELLELDSAREIEVGKKFDEVLRTGEELKFVDDQELLDRVNDAAAPFLTKLIRDEITYTFSVVDDKAINAFSIPGGYIYVNTGLLDFVKSDKELEFVLGHEIGHIDLKHCSKNYTYAARAGDFGGILTEAATLRLYHVYALSFSEEMEYEADKYAMERMLQSGASTPEVLAFSEHMVEYMKSNDGVVAEEQPENVPGAVFNSIDNHFRSHPPSQARLDRLKRLADRLSKQKSAE